MHRGNHRLHSQALVSICADDFGLQVHAVTRPFAIESRRCLAATDLAWPSKQIFVFLRDPSSPDVVVPCIILSRII